MNSSKNELRIGIFGGSFDPVHTGHVCLAQDAVKQAALDELIFVPAYIQPFKQDKKATASQHRFEMLRLAAEGEDKFRISSYELDHPGVSYTYLTLRYMKELYAKAAKQQGKELKIYFLCGTDSFLKLEYWKNAEELLTNYSFIIGSRPGYKQDELKETMNRIREKFGTESINIHNRLRDISATEIRELIAGGHSISEVVPLAVEKYIEDHELYR